MLVCCSPGAAEDVRLLAPLVWGMSPEDVTTLLPRFLTLAPPQLRQLYWRLTSKPPSSSSPEAGGHFTAAELLLRLHNIDPGKAGVTMNQQLVALDTALHAPETFPQSTIAQVGHRGF